MEIFDLDSDQTSRRQLLRLGAGLASFPLLESSRVWLGQGSQGATFEDAAARGLAALDRLQQIDSRDGGAVPLPIPWLDKNGSFNQSPGPNQEPSNIFHFKGVVARANGYVGMGRDQHGTPVPFGTKTTDFSFMQGEYWAGRKARTGAFTHT